MKIEITEFRNPLGDSLDYEVRSGDNFCRFSISGGEVSTDLEELKAEIVYAVLRLYSGVL